MPANYNQYQTLQPITMYPVHGIDGANAFPVGPGQKVNLIDIDSAVIYVKSANQFGQALPLEIYDMNYRQPPQPEVSNAAPAMTKEEIIATVDTAVQAAMQKYFPQLKFND